MQKSLIMQENSCMQDSFSENYRKLLLLSKLAQVLSRGSSEFNLFVAEEWDLCSSDFKNFAKKIKIKQETKILVNIILTTQDIEVISITKQGFDSVT